MDCQIKPDNAVHNLSCSAKAEYPVFTKVARLTATLASTGSPAFAGDDKERRGRPRQAKTSPTMTGKRGVPR